MMKFTIGLAIIAFTLIVGGYKYTENADLVAIKETGLRQVIGRKDAANKLLARYEEIKKKSIKTGDDQKFTIERTLNIGEGGLEFKFLGQSSNEDGDALYNHTFRISGPANFAELMRVTQQLSTLPGFSVYRVCYACDKPKKKQKLKDGQHMVTIEGYLYVYDPNTIL